MGGTGTGFSLNALVKSTKNKKITGVNSRPLSRFDIDTLSNKSSRKRKKEIQKEIEELQHSLEIKAKINLAPTIFGDSEYVQRSKPDLRLQDISSTHARKELVQLDDIHNVLQYLRPTLQVKKAIADVNTLVNATGLEASIYLSGELIQPKYKGYQKVLTVHLITKNNPDKIIQYMETSDRFDTTYNKNCFRSFPETYAEHSIKGNPNIMLVELIDQTDEELFFNREFLNYRIGQKRTLAGKEGIPLEDTKEYRKELLETYK